MTGTDRLVINQELDRKGLLPKGKGEPMDERVLHELYKGQDVRSCPYEFLQKWKVRLDITFPNGDGRKTIGEYLDKKRSYATQGEAHTAGFVHGRRIIDQWIEEHSN